MAGFLDMLNALLTSQPEVPIDRQVVQGVQQAQMRPSPQEPAYAGGGGGWGSEMPTPVAPNPIIQKLVQGMKQRDDARAGFPANPMLGEPNMPPPAQAPPPATKANAGGGGGGQAPVAPMQDIPAAPQAPAAPPVDLSQIAASGGQGGGFQLAPLLAGVAAMSRDPQTLGKVTGIYDWASKQKAVTDTRDAMAILTAAKDPMDAMGEIAKRGLEYDPAMVASMLQSKWKLSAATAQKLAENSFKLRQMFAKFDMDAKLQSQKEAAMDRRFNAGEYGKNQRAFTPTADSYFKAADAIGKQIDALRMSGADKEQVAQGIAQLTAKQQAFMSQASKMMGVPTAPENSTALSWKNFR